MGELFLMKRHFFGLLLLTGMLFMLAVPRPAGAQEPCSQIQSLRPGDCLVPQVLNTYDHDTTAFTQGLIWLDGALYESTGLYGESTLREVDLETGEVQRRVDLNEAYFAEGLELVNGRLIQLTWREGEAFVYNPETFERVDTYTYEGEGWGLCYDDRYLYMSDSTPYLSVRDAETFELIVRPAVTYRGSRIPPQLLNELECVGDSIYANLWNTDYIVEIDKYTGNITGWIDASSLLDSEVRQNLESGQVLNGIAYNPETETFYITGKRWPVLFEVTFEQVETDE
jgi:glutamine cyclotransferase